MAHNVPEANSHYQQLLGLSRELSRNSPAQLTREGDGSPYLQHLDWEANSQPDITRDFKMDGQSVEDFTNDFDRASHRSSKSLRSYDMKK